MSENRGAIAVCPWCENTASQVKAGLHGGNQRYKCMVCLRRYTPEPKARGYSEEVRQQALALVTRGVKPRQAALQLGVTPQTIRKWLERKSRLTEPPEPPRLLPAAPPGKWKATISDVAASAGVSIATVSNYLNNKGRMGASTRDRVRQAMEDLHFTPSGLMQGIRHRRTRILGVMMFDLSSLGQNIGTAVAPQLLAGINAAAFEAAHNILLYTGLQYQPSRPAGIEFLDGHIDGLLWVARELHEPTLERVAAAGLPTLALLTRHVPEGVGYVDADNAAGARALVLHLAERGHRRIAYVGVAHSSNLRDRLEGYRQGLAAAGLPHDPRLEATEPPMRQSPEAHAQALERWMRLPEPPTAVMVQNDRCAAILLEALRHRGLRVPEDIAVTGFDDAPDAQWLGGGLTTMRQPFAHMGKLAVQSLIALIESAPVAECRRTVPTELIVRASTG